MCAWSHHYSPSQVKHSHMPQPILKMVPDWTSTPKASGTTGRGIREYFLMYRSLTPTFNHTSTGHSSLPQSTGNRRERSKEITNRESVKLNSVHSPLSCFQHLVAWPSVPLCPTNGSHPCSQQSVISHTASL